MSISATLFGKNSFLFKLDNVLSLGLSGFLDRKFGVPDTHPSLGDIAQQTAKEGEPRPIIWGRVRPIGGNIIHCSKPKVVKKKQKSGKGGGGGQTETQTIYRTYALRICEGPVTGVIRAWRNNKLVYDARGNAWGLKNNSIYLKKARFFLGDFDQMPSADLEAIWGAGSVSAYRGTCYVVMANEDVTDCGGAVPQWLFEVERAEYIPLTSRPYPLEMDVEGIGILPPSLISIDLKRLLLDEPPESLGLTSSLSSIDLRTIFHSYTVPPESLGLTSSLSSIDLRQTLQSYDNGIDQLGITGSLSSIDLKVILQSYTIPTESLGITASLSSINLGP